MSLDPSIKKENLIFSFLVCLFVYVIAAGAAVGVGFLLYNRLHIISVTLIADVTATLVIYIFSHLFKNTSLYDAYWSVAPIVIVLFWLFISGSLATISAKQIIVLVMVGIWGTRLTLNWARGWGGLKHEDWRYTKYREDMPKLFWFINLTGLQLMPTVLVFLGCLSLYPVLFVNITSFTYLDGIGIAVVSIGILLETISDEQLRKFRKVKEKGQLMISGLWGVSRHPNYLGEISFWWGLYFFALSANLNYWWVIVGPVAITVLFFAISMPMMEKRMLKEYPQYTEYKKKVSMMIPWFQKRKK